MEDRQMYLRKISFLFLYLLSLFLIGSSLIHAQTQHFQTCWSGNPFQPMNIFVFEAKYNGLDLVAGDEVAIFDESECVGAEVLTGVINQTNLLQIVASKSENAGGCGFEDDNMLVIKVWDSSH